MNDTLGLLSRDEQALIRMTDSGRINSLSIKAQLYLELGTPRTQHYGYILREEDGAFRVGWFVWKLDKCEERTFDEFKTALDFLIERLEPQ